MTIIPSGQATNPSTPSVGRVRTQIVVIAIGACGFAAGAVAGAYLNWFWWEIGYRLNVTILAVALLVTGCILSLIRRRVTRGIGLASMAVGFGLLAGQLIGPGREPLIEQPGGTMTLRLESPVVVVMTGSADCQNVASQTEFMVLGAPDQLPGERSLPDSIVVQSGDRWAYPRDNSRPDRVRLELGVTTRLDPATGKVSSRIGMEATEASTLESTFRNEGGSISFADLVAVEGPAFTGESIDLAGTLEWTCGAPVP